MKITPLDTTGKNPRACSLVFPNHFILTTFFVGSFHIDLTPWKNTGLKGHLNERLSSF